MMAQTRIQIAKSDIVKFFDELPKQIHTYKELSSYLQDKRAFWRLTLSMTAREFVDWLTKHTKLRVAKFPFAKPYRPETRYVWGDVPFYEVVLSLKPRSYFSHFTAVYLNGLTDQIPKTIYLNHEQALASNSTAIPTQKSIEAAFKRRVRTSRNIADTVDFRVCVLFGKNTGELGVIEDVRPDLAGTALRPAKIRLTNIERTLIDITVRPVYAGGVSEVLNAYRNAKDRVSVNRLSAMLKNLAYIYPYHQVVGFYLDRADYHPSQIDLLRKEPFEFNFYLAHQMGETDFDKKWRLFVPKGF
jgi:hypothetical protein